MKNYLKVRVRTIAEQISAIRNKYPHFKSSFVGHTSLKVKGQAQPTSRSEVYTFELTYELNKLPRVYVISPKLMKNDNGEQPPHLYPNGDLCLYRPKYGEFTKSDFLTDTVIPWISLWLYYYEIWLLTGYWHGGGEHPSSGKSSNRINAKKSRFKRKFSH